jgi:RNA polymerase sigma-70 factor (ECF subfamily)
MRRRSTREKNYAELARVSLDLFAASPQADEESLRKALSAALEELPPDQRAVAHLKLWENATFEQIAETLGIPANTAASRYRYAMDKLRQRLRIIYEEIKQ